MFKDEVEKQYVISKLVEHLGPLQNPREVLLAGLLATPVPGRVLGGPPEQLVLEVVQCCLNDAWGHDPTYLALLLMPFRALDAKIPEIIKRLDNRPPPTGNPLDQHILNDGALFVNRVQLRGHMRRLATPASNLKPILVVTGTTKAGKSYSSKYIEHFCNVQLASMAANQRMIISNRIEFDHERAADLGAKEVAQQLLDMMGSPLRAPDNLTNNILYPQQLASMVLNAAVQTGWNNWFVLDNFRDAGDKKLPKDTSDFLVALSSQITTGAASNFCRLILIGFDRARLRVDTDRVEEEVIAKCTKPDIDQAIAEICRRTSVQLDISRIENFVYTALPENETKLIELNFRLRKLLYAITGLTTILAGHAEINFEDVLHEMLDQLPEGEDGMTELKKRIADLGESIQEL
ncbi:MAG TPA: hypothetical protein VD996_12690 [Chitinophagaceae bacterium]|nr:hypothetical protein [Chitinophagaceae bacterium]